jgi:hypothetical protein
VAEIVEILDLFFIRKVTYTTGKETNIQGEVSMQLPA